MHMDLDVQATIWGDVVMTYPGFSYRVYAAVEGLGSAFFLLWAAFPEP